jgi:hypothetical protein
MNTIPTVRTIATTTFLGGVVALSVATVFSWGNLFAASAPQAGDDPLTNRLAIVEPFDRTRTEAAGRTAVNSAAVTDLNNWEFTDTNPSRYH